MANIRITAATATHNMVLAGPDMTIAAAIPEHRLFRIIGGAYENGQRVGTKDLLDVAESTLQHVRAEWKVLPYRYGIEACIGGRADCKTAGSGGVSGFLIGGRIHSIMCGAGECLLEVLEDNGPEDRRFVFAADLRGRGHIDTDDWGPIKITRRKLKLTLPEQLELLVAFLKPLSDDEVFVLYTEGEQSVMDLVRLAFEGNEYGEEEIFNRGDPARQELIRRLSNSKARKYRQTIAWILLTCLPSPEARETIERQAEREKDADLKNQLVLLLTSIKG